MHQPKELNMTVEQIAAAGYAAWRARARRGRGTAGPSRGSSGSGARTARSATAAGSSTTRGWPAAVASPAGGRGHTGNGGRARSAGTKRAVLEALASGNAMTAPPPAARRSLLRARRFTTLHVSRLGSETAISLGYLV